MACACCGILTPCCDPIRLPRQVVFTITGGTPCACMDGFSATLDVLPPSIFGDTCWVWTGAWCAGFNWDITFCCIGTTYHFNTLRHGAGGASDIVNGPATNCDPLLFTGTMNGLLYGCGGGASWTFAITAA
jgi:hypothetical protein